MGISRLIHKNLHERAERDFADARRKAVLRQIGAFLRGNPASNRLLSFEEVKRELGAAGRAYLGMRTVPVSKIVGSVGRHADFDRAFLPSRGHLGEQWKSIDRVTSGVEELPPVSLYKIGDDYFVLDGNHRVSVARYRGAVWIDAEVTEFRTPQSAGSVSAETSDGMRRAPALLPVARQHRATRRAAQTRRSA